MRKAFVIPPQFRMERVPGQIPAAPEDREAMRQINTMPAGPSMARLMTHGDLPRSSIDSITKGLGMDAYQERSWHSFLSSTLSLPNELQVRKALYSKFLEDKVDPELRRALFERSMSYLTTTRKSEVEIVTVDDLHKGETRGGSYHRRVPVGKGKFKYYYDPEKYNAEHSHLSGTDARKTYVTKKLHSVIESAGDDGLHLDDLKAHAKRHGAQLVASVLQDGVKGGHVLFQNNRFRKPKSGTTPVKPAAKPEETKKSERFVIPRGDK